MDVSANKGDAYVVGVDFGTLSARALVVQVRDGAEAGTAVSEYPHGVIDRSLDGHGELPPDWALQDPADWTRALGEAIPAAVRDAGIDPAQVIGIATDFTASTCMPVLAERGLRVPEDVSIVGFDDVPEAGFYRPPLTTVRQDFGEVGRQALNTLVDRMYGAIPAGPRVRVAPELIIRASAGGLG